MLTRQLAQAIVGKLMSVLGKNINIMDQQGNIMASGDESRVNTFHQGAAQAVKDRKVLEVWADNVRDMEGVRPGINVPIEFEGKVVGVVGITGEPSEVRNYGQLVRYTAELMLEQAALKEQVHLSDRAREGYLQDLISGNWEEDEPFIQRGLFLGFNLRLPRVALVVELDTAAVANNQKEFSYWAAVEVHHTMDTVQDQLKARLGEKCDITGLVGGNRVVILTGYQEQGHRPAMETFAQQVLAVVETATTYQARIGVGRYHPGLTGLQQSFAESIEAVNLSRRLKLPGQINFFKDIQVEYLISSIPAGQRSNFAASILADLYGDAGSTKSMYKGELLSTLAAFLRYNLSIKDTAAALFIHRNTLLHRLKKISAVTGLNPADFNDAFKLKLAMLFEDLNKER